MDVTLPNGQIVKGVPDGTTKAQLAEKLKANGMDVPDEWFAPPVPAQDPAQFGGAGGFNPMLPRLAGAASAIASPLGVTPKNSSNQIANAVGPLESVWQAVTGTVGNAAGLAAKYLPMGTNPAAIATEQLTGAGERRKQAVQDALTYQPRTATGQGIGRVLGSVPNYAVSKAEQYGGPMARDALEIAALAEGARGVGKGSVGETYAGKYDSAKFDIPTTQQLKTAAQDAYAAGKESGVVVPASGYNKALTDIRKMTTDEGIDPTLHPKSTAVMKRLEQAQGNDLSLQQAETLRKIALDAEDDVNSVGKPTADARLAGKIVDELDNKIEALSVNDQARALWSRTAKSQLVDTMIHRAEIKAGAHYTQAGMEHALRQEFKTLALNPRRMRGFTAEQRAAVEKVAKGGPLENTLRILGKFDPTSGVIPAMASIATGGAMPLIGFASRRAATRATVRNVDAAREALVGRGLPTFPQRQIAPQTASPSIDMLDFQQTPGVMPAKAAAMSRGVDFPPAPVANSTELPTAPERGLAASAPPQMYGGLPFKNYLLKDSGNLSVAPDAPKYTGGVDFSPTPLNELYAAKLAGDMKLAEPGTATARQTGRAPNMIFSELRRLEGEVQNLPASEPFDSPKRKALEKKMERLRAELLLSVSKGVSQQ